VTRADSFDALVADNAAAVAEFAARAAAIPPDRWDVARAPGKWTPAQETKHVSLGYQAFVRDLRGEGALRLKGRWWQRRLWRWLILPAILADGRITRHAPAPREVRPGDRPGDRTSLLSELTDSVAGFEAMILKTHGANRRRRVTHPYFNGLTLEQLLRLCAVHTRHHAAYLPAGERVVANR